MKALSNNQAALVAAFGTRVPLEACPFGTLVSDTGSFIDNECNIHVRFITMNKRRVYFILAASTVGTRSCYSVGGWDSVTADEDDIDFNKPNMAVGMSGIFGTKMHRDLINEVRERYFARLDRTWGAAWFCVSFLAPLAAATAALMYAYTHGVFGPVHSLMSTSLYIPSCLALVGLNFGLGVKFGPVFIRRRMHEFWRTDLRAQILDAAYYEYWDD